MAAGPRAPYQPSLLCLLHALTAVLVLLCWISGVALYSQFDGRWGRIPLRLPDVIDLHGSLGVGLILAAPQPRRQCRTAAGPAAVPRQRPADG